MGYMMGHQPAFNERLIKEVKKHPSLYNQTKRSFTDTMERMKIWDLIAQAIDPKVSGEFAKKRWLQLRDRYRKELKVAIRQNFSVPQRWCYFSHLSWLDPYLKDNLALSMSLAERPSRSVEADGGSSSVSPFPPASLLSLDLFLKKEPRSIHDLDDGFDEPLFDDELLRVSVSSALERVLAATRPPPPLPPPPILSDSGDSMRGESSSFSSSSTSRPLSTSGDSSPKSDQSDLKPTDDRFRVENTDRGPVIRVNGRAVETNNFTAITKHLVQSNPSMGEWVNDEEMLFARIVGLKLRKMSTRQRKRVKSDIITLLDESDNDDDEDDLLKLTPKTIRLS